CKHIMHVLQKAKRRFLAQELRKPYRRKHLALHLRYDGDEVTLRLLTPERVDDDVARIIKPIRDQPITDLHDLVKRIASLQKVGRDVSVYPDAEEFIQQRLLQERLRARTVEIRLDPANHPLRQTLLKVPLLPYQLDGIAFAAGAGRAVLADDM